METDDEDRKEAHLALIQRAVGLKEDEIRDRTEVFEKVAWAFRSEMVCISASHHI
jgi:hypothetical protein